MHNLITNTNKIIEEIKGIMFGNVQGRIQKRKFWTLLKNLFKYILLKKKKIVCFKNKKERRE